MSKLVKSIREAIALSGLKDGMTVSFHHHLRNGDFVLNMVMEEIANAGIKDMFTFFGGQSYVIIMDYSL